MSRALPDSRDLTSRSNQTSSTSCRNMFARSGELTPLTQLTTFGFARRAGAGGRFCAESRFRRRNSVHDRGAGIVDLDLCDERADDVPPFEPGEIVESLSDASGELLDLRDDSAQVDRLAKLLVGFVEFAPRAFDPRTHGVASVLELLEIDGTDLMRVYESLQAWLVNRKTPSGDVSTFAQLGRNAVALLAVRPLVEHSRWILQQLADGLPDVAVQLIDANLRVVANASARKTVGVTANATVVGVTVAPFCRRLGDGLSVES